MRTAVGGRGVFWQGLGDGDWGCRTGRPHNLRDYWAHPLPLRLPLERAPDCPGLNSARGSLNLSVSLRDVIKNAAARPELLHPFALMSSAWHFNSLLNANSSFVFIACRQKQGSPTCWLLCHYYTVSVSCENRLAYMPAGAQIYFPLCTQSRVHPVISILNWLISFPII